MRKMVMVFPIMLILISCAARPPMTTEEYKTRPQLKESLFASDNEVLSNEAIREILNSKIVLPEDCTIAVMKFPDKREKLNLSGGYYGYSTVREDFQKTQQEYLSVLIDSLQLSDRVSGVVVLPTLLTPESITIPILREAAVRLQADLILVYRPETFVYDKFILFRSDKVKGYCTCEAVLLDVRTGIIPLTCIVSENFEGRKSKEDMDNDDMKRRAEKEATLKALGSIGSQVTEFIAKVE
ncbi:MAG: hypothetical protein KAR42_10425 [candidate division Zixibacteria bacterium]|nr:hypothetical protein [candidate division Zixibacteria bacterium]